MHATVIAGRMSSRCIAGNKILRGYFALSAGPLLQVAAVFPHHEGNHPGQLKDAPYHFELVALV